MTLAPVIIYHDFKMVDSQAEAGGYRETSGMTMPQTLSLCSKFKVKV